MKFFRRRRVNFERVPPQVGRNEYIRCWHWDNGLLSHLVVDATAESLESKERHAFLIKVYAIVMLISFALAYGIVQNPKIEGTGSLVFFLSLVFVPFVEPVITWLVRDKRIFTVTTKTLTVKRPDGTYEFDLNSIVGVHLYRVDQQRVHKEYHDKRKKKDPEYFSPYSMDLVLETTLGPQVLGSIFGLQDAQAITNAINAAIQFMKGRAGTGNGPVVDPRFQYRNKSAGRIPM